MAQSWIRRAVEQVLDAAVLAFFLPGQVVLLGGFDHGVAQPFGVVAGHDELDRGEEGADEDLLLVVQVLADAFADRDDGALEFQHAQGDAVDVEHDVGALVVLAADGHLFGDGEVVVRAGSSS